MSYISLDSLSAFALTCIVIEFTPGTNMASLPRKYEWKAAWQKMSPWDGDMLLLRRTVTATFK